MNPRSLTISRFGNQALIRENFDPSRDMSGLGIIPALIMAGATLAATGASIVMQKKAEKKQAKAAKKAKAQYDQQIKAQEESEAAALKAAEDAKARGTASTVAATKGGMTGMLPWLAVGGAVILGVAFVAMKK
jgi:uncharacterized protein involved in exopolysaccharide biosynthesis